MRILLIAMTLLLAACTTDTVNVISTNNLYQSDYDYNCLDGTKTFTQIIVCTQAQDAAEKSQNNITNELLSQ